MPVSKSVKLNLLSFRCMCVMQKKTFIVTKMAFDEGIFINPVIPPACARKIRWYACSIDGYHTKEQVDYAVEKLTKYFRELGE